MPSPPDSPRTSPRLVGRAVERVEDAALLTGRGRFADDVGERPGTAHAAVLRSPHAHAEIVSLDATAALSMPEVVTVLTGAEVAAWSPPFIAGVKQPMRHYALAVDRVRYTGEPVAVVVARDRYGAEDALERIEVEYRELDPVVDPVAAAAPGAPLLHRDVGSNVVSARRFRYGDPDAAFASAAHRVAISVRYPRNACTPIEGFVVVAEHLGEDGYERGQVRQVGLHRHRNGGGIEVTAELKSNGTRVQRTGTSNGNGSLPPGGANRDCIGGGVPVVRSADAGGGESGLAPRHGRLERSKTGPYLSTRAAGSAASSNRRLQYFAGSADRWVVLPILRPPTVGPGTRRRSAARRGPAPGAPSGHDTWCVVPCDGSPRPALPRASPEPRACGSRTCPVRQAPREYVAPRTSHGCAGESRVHARSAPRQSALVANALGCATRSTRSGRHRALEPWWRFGIRPGALS